MKTRFLFIFSFLMLSSIFVIGDVQRTISYQGKMTDSFGVGINDTLPMIFQIYSVETGGLPLWTETHDGVNEVHIFKGLFDVILGSINPLNLPFDEQYWLEVIANADTLLPRFKLTSSPYALNIPDTIYKNNPGYAALTIRNTSSSDYSEGIVIDSTTGDGMNIYNAGRGGMHIVNSNLDGIHINGTADGNGIVVMNTEYSGINIEQPGGFGIKILNDDYPAGKYGIYSSSDNISDTVGYFRGNVYIHGEESADNFIARSGITLGGDYRTTWPGGGGNWLDSSGVLYTNESRGIAKKHVWNKIWGSAFMNSHVNLGISCTTGTEGFNRERCTVSGGEKNVAADFSSTVGGGYNNKALESSSTVGGGQNNKASGDKSTVGGGQGNNASGESSTINGGSDNTIIGAYSAVPGGRSITVSGQYSMGFGYQVDVADNYRVIFFEPGYMGKLGINEENPSQELDIHGNISLDGGIYDDGTTGWGISGQCLKTNGSGDIYWGDCGGGSSGVSGIRANSNPYLTGDITLQQGTNVTLSQSGNTITINASGGGGGISSISEGTGIDCSPNPITSTGTVSFNTSWGDGRYALDSHDHWGETWSGSGRGLDFNGSSSSANIVEIGNSGYGSGLYVESNSTTDEDYAIKGKITGTSGNNFGVYGTTNSLTLNSTGSAAGVYGWALNSGEGGDVFGVLGRCTTKGGYGPYPNVAAGVYAFAEAPYGQTYGLYAESASSTDLVSGVYGANLSATGQVRGVIGALNASNTTNGTAGVLGWSSASSGVVRGVWGGASSSSGYGLYSSGNTGATGTKSALVLSSKGPISLYCMESPEVWFEDFGEGFLEDGVAFISIDPLFLETVTIDQNNNYHVFIQPYGESNNLIVERKTKSFIVREINNGKSNISFGYRIIAKRKGYEDKRLDHSPAGYTDPFLYPEVKVINEVVPKIRD